VAPEVPARPRSPHAYPKEARLRLQREFQAVRARGRRRSQTLVNVRVLSTDLGRARLGLASPRWYGDAIRRNRFRRLAREAFRSIRSRLPSVDLLVEPRRDLKEPTLEGLVRDLLFAAGTPPR
jgi:ribonuclease P protein component